MKGLRNVIIQAGGRGSRMGHLTDNRPKCLVPIDGKPILHSVSNAFGTEIEAVIIADYKSEVLEQYLKSFPPPFSWSIVIAEGKGTCSGIQKAVELFGNEPFALVWSDLWFTKTLSTLESPDNFIGVSREIECRWSYTDGNLAEEPNDESDKLGVPGVFIFNEPSLLPDVPKDGEFVRFLADSNIRLNPFVLDGVKEIGTYRRYRKVRDSIVNSRFFNEVRIENKTVLKKARNSSYNGLIEDEVNWYKFVARKGFNNVPKIVSYSPLVMERIRGDHPFNLMNGQKASLKDKKEIISKIIDSLMELHSIANTRRIQAVAKEVYVEKTLKRISVISGIVPHSDSDFYYVNGKKAPNLLIHQNLPYLESLYSLISKESPDSPFTLIHGDPTFSNILIKSTDAMPIFIDPRGYFGSLKLFGDPLYDFSKLYYSAIGNYDFFNQGKFRLKMNNGSIEIKIKSEGFEGTQSLFSEYFDKQILAIRGLHALIWISLSGYVTDDYDAMLGSYFHGIQLMAEVLNDYA